MYLLIIKDTFDQYSLEKVIVHCCHNAERASLHTQIHTPERQHKWWFEDAGTKILVWVKNEDQLVKLCQKALGINRLIATSTQTDAGFSEVAEGTIIGGAIGPVTDTEAKAIGLKKLSLFKIPQHGKDD